MAWEADLEELKRRREMAEKLGGENSVAFQHSRGKLTARERIDALVDAGSWREIGTLTGKADYADDGALQDVTPSNAVIGRGKIDGRKVSVSADDFTIRGGSSEATISSKWIYAERYALEMRMPLVRLVDTAGGSVKLLEQMQSTKIPGYWDWPQLELMGSVPVVGVAMGACAGLGAVKVGMSHFSVMVKDSSQVFAAGPPVVKRAFGVDVDKNDLGGHKVHARASGVVNNEAKDDLDALLQVKTFLSYMPRNVWETPPEQAPTDDPDRTDPALRDIVPEDRRKAFDMRAIIRSVCDAGSVFEIAPRNGRSQIACLARIDGKVTGVLGSDCRFDGGAMTRNSAEKLTKFIDLCDTFHIPIVNFVDQPGVMPGVEAERSGTFKAVLNALGAIEQSQVPWLSIMVRRAFGVGGGMHGRKKSVNLRFAWPAARWGSIPAEGGIQAAYKRELAELDEEGRTARLAELEEYYGRFASPFRTAERFAVSDIIDPAETRPLVCDWIDEAYDVVRGQTGPVARTMRP